MALITSLYYNHDGPFLRLDAMGRSERQSKRDADRRRRRRDADDTGSSGSDGPRSAPHLRGPANASTS